jgi:transcriptional repressor NrdR
LNPGQIKVTLPARKQNTKDVKVICPFCQHTETKVIDSRLATNGNQIKRRRECCHCVSRFSTFETATLIMPTVIKRDGRRSPFSEEKLRKGLLTALEKRPVSVDVLETMIQSILKKIQQCGEREITSQKVGSIAMNALKTIDQIAYIRFASVYWAFNDITHFYDLLQGFATEATTG